MTRDGVILCFTIASGYQIFYFPDEMKNYERKNYIIK
jgi:hypothetical protein